jgi:DNA-binding transcriptional LysR family regulator
LSQPATNRRALASRELGALPLLARPSVDARLRAEGVEPRTVLRCDDDALLQAAAAAGAGIAILPATAVTRQDVAVLELRPEISLPVIGLVHSRRSDTTLRALVDAACAASADLPHRTDRSMSLAVTAGPA